MGNTNNLVVENYWVTKPYSDLGLLDILTLDGYVVAEDIEESIARYLTELHNFSWDSVVWGSYYDNIELSLYQDYVESQDLPDHLL